MWAHDDGDDDVGDDHAAAADDADDDSDDDAADDDGDDDWQAHKTATSCPRVPRTAASNTPSAQNPQGRTAPNVPQDATGSSLQNTPRV